MQPIGIGQSQKNHNDLHSLYDCSNHTKIHHLTQGISYTRCHTSWAFLFSDDHCLPYDSAHVNTFENKKYMHM